MGLLSTKLVERICRGLYRTAGCRRYAKMDRCNLRDVRRSQPFLYVLMLEGSSPYKLDVKNEAYDVFEKIYELFRREGFKGEQLQYLEFYLKERAKRG